MTSLYLIRSNRRLFARLGIALGRAPRAGAAADRGARVDAASHRPRAARRIRTDADRDGIDARPRRATRRRRARRSQPSCARSPSSRRRTLEQVRSLSQALHPSHPRRDRARERRSTGICRPSSGRSASPSPTSGPDRPLPVERAPSAIHVYRVLQEALNNVARHSGADRRRGCGFASRRRVLELDVEDHGTGHRPVSAAARARRRGDARAGGAGRRHDRVPAAARRRARWCALRGAAADSVPTGGGRACRDRQITVLLADDHSLVRRGFRRLLEDDPSIVGRRRGERRRARRSGSPRSSGRGSS